MAEDALQMRAREAFEDTTDDDGQRRKIIRRRAGTVPRSIPWSNAEAHMLFNQGDKWMVYGPREFIPPLEAELIQRKRAFLQMEGLNVYLFNPEIVIAVAVLILLALIFLGRALGGSSGASDTHVPVPTVLPANKEL